MDGWASIGDPHKDVIYVKIALMKSFQSVDSCYWFFDRQFAHHWLALHQDTKKERQYKTKR